MADISKINPNGTEYDIKDAVARGMVEGSKPATGNPITLTDASESYAEELKVTLEPIQSGSGTPSPSNIRPITGYTEVNVGRVGKNKLPMTVAGIKAANTSGTWSGNVYTINAGTFTILTDSDNNVIGIKVNGTFNASTEFICFKQESAVLQTNETYIVNQTPTSLSNGYIGVSTGGSSVYVTPNEGSEQFTTTTNTRLSVWLSVSGSYSNVIVYPMIRLSTETDPTFAPYQSSNATISFGQEVYGCDVDMLTGKVVVDRGFDTFDGSSDENWWNSSGGARAVTTLSNQIKGATNTRLEVISNEGYFSNSENNTGVIFGWSNGSELYFYPPNGASDISAFKTWLSSNPLQVCYELDTHQTYQLTPQELKLLKQYNYITTNGTTISLKYQPDNVIGEAIGVCEEYTDRHFAWKKVGEYYSGDLVTIDGEWSEILLTTYTSINNGYNMSVVYPFALFGVASLTAFNEANGEITLNSTLLDTKYVRMTGLSGAKMHVYVR